MARGTAAVSALSVGAFSGVLWASLELTAARAWSLDRALPVMACSVATTSAVLPLSAVLAWWCRRRGSTLGRLVFFEVAAISSAVLALWGYLEYSGAHPPLSARTAVILAIALAGALVPAGVLAWLAEHAVARASGRLRAVAGAGGLLTLAASALWLVTCRLQADPERWERIGRASASEPNVVLLIADTLRADHVSALGYARPTTPNLEEIGGVLFTAARSVAAWTRPAVATMVSGLHPETHGVLNLTSTLPGDLPLVTEAFAQAGFATAFLTANPNTGAVFDFDRGCDVFFDSSRHPLARLLPTTLGQLARRIALRFDRASRLNAEVLRFLERVRERRFFLVVHYNDPHAPYTPAAPFDRLFGSARSSPSSRDPSSVNPETEAQRQAAMSSYDGEIAALDRAIRDLLDEMARRGLLARTSLVLVSDHGEEFADHGRYGHGRTLFEEILRVLLLVRPAGEEQPLIRSAPVVSQLDVAPTLLDLGHVEPPLELPGRSLLPFLSDPSLPGRPVLATGVLPKAAAWCDGHTKLILDPVSGRASLFDLDADPEEQNDLASTQALRVEELRAMVLHQLGQYQATRLQSHDPALSPDVERELRALGYVR